jgi:hypothetical protein
VIEFVYYNNSIALLPFQVNGFGVVFTQLLRFDNGQLFFRFLFKLSPGGQEKKPRNHSGPKPNMVLGQSHSTPHHDHPDQH